MAAVYASSPVDASEYGDESEDHFYGEWTSSVEPGDVPTAIQNLLHSTQSLQQTLHAWSTQQASEQDVSNLYVQIGHQFNDVVAAFAYHQIDISDIHCIPSDLREVLEGCLSEEPEPKVYEAFVGRLRGVLWKMLKGLQAKQGEWRAAVIAARQMERSARLGEHGLSGSGYYHASDQGPGGAVHWQPQDQSQQRHPPRTDSLVSVESADSGSVSNGSRVNGTSYEAWLQAQSQYQR